MVKKLISVFFLSGAFALLYTACCGESAAPFFDYNKLEITNAVLADPQIKATATLQIYPADLSFIAVNVPLGLMPAAYGLECPQPGRDGPKHKITAIEITAGQPFNDTLPAGASLSPLFLSYFGLNLPVSELTDLTEFFGPESALVLYTTILPIDTSQVFDLSVRITKDNGSMANGVINGVKFK